MLRARAGFKQFFRPSDPFYSIYNVGPYTISPHKVVWREQSAELQAARLAVTNGKPIVPDHKLMSVSCQSEEEANYVAALLNSAPCRLVVQSYIVATSTSTHVLQHIAIPQFQHADPIHLKLADLSGSCHDAAAIHEQDSVYQLESQIDELAASLWGVTARELVAMQETLRHAREPTVSTVSKDEKDD